MSFNTIVRKVKSVAESSNLNISVVEGLRSEDLPTPCISVHLESAMNFNQGFTDVFTVLVTIKYEEHYADKPATIVNDNFKKLLDVFIVDDLIDKLTTPQSRVFNAKITDVSTSIAGDFFANQFTIEAVAERDS